MSLENLTHLYVISYWKFSEIKLMDDFQRIQSCNLTPNDYISLRPTAPTVPITAFLYIFLYNDILNQKQSQELISNFNFSKNSSMNFILSLPISFAFSVYSLSGIFFNFTSYSIKGECFDHSLILPFSTVLFSI